MRVRQIQHSLRGASLPCLLLACLPLALSACGGEQQVYDWKNRVIDWTYGPTNGAARAEHLTGTGKQGSGKVAEGWRCRLSDGKTLSVNAFELASSHVLFDEAILIIGLFDETGKRLDTVRSTTLTAGSASFSFELAEDVAKQLWDVVIWYGKP